MTELPDIRQADVRGKTVLLRADLNVPMDNGTITDATRIERFIPTISDLTNRGAAVLIMTHLGRPNGEVNPVLSTRPLAEAVSKALQQDVTFIPSVEGRYPEDKSGLLRPGDVGFLESVRFHPGETANSKILALQLSVFGDIYVNDAFSCAHRAHASTYAITETLPSFAGPSLIAEVEALEMALETPARPVAALVGGAKVSTKIAVLENLLPKVDHLIIGGGMANTFLAALDFQMGRSLVEDEAVQLAKKIIADAKAANCTIVLPEDLVVASEFAANAPNRVVTASQISEHEMALDVGPATCLKINEVLETCRVLLWNGPLGAFEIEPFGEATFTVAGKAAELTQHNALVTVAGGGDTVAALNAAGTTGRFTYVSTAGGAFLEWLEGKDLPGIAALLKSERRKEIA